MPYNATKIRIKFDKKRLSTESLSNIYKSLFFRKVSNSREYEQLIQKETDAFTKKVDELVVAKEKEMMTV